MFKRSQSQRSKRAYLKDSGPKPSVLTRAKRMFTSEKAGRKKEKRAKSLEDRENLTKAKSEENQMQRVDEPREETPAAIKVKDEEGDVLHTCAESRKIPEPEHAEKQLCSTSDVRLRDLRLSISTPPTSHIDQGDDDAEEDEDEPGEAEDREEEEEEQEQSQGTALPFPADSDERNQILSQNPYSRVQEPSSLPFTFFDTHEHPSAAENGCNPQRRAYGRPRQSTIHGMDPSLLFNVHRDPRGLGVPRPQQPVSLDMVEPRGEGFRAHTPRTDETPDSLLNFRLSQGKRSASLGTTSSGVVSAAFTAELRRNLQDLGIGVPGQPSPTIAPSEPMVGFRGMLPRSNHTPELDISFPECRRGRRRFL